MKEISLPNAPAVYAARVHGDEAAARWLAAARLDGFRPRISFGRDGCPVLAVVVSYPSEVARLAWLMRRAGVAGTLERLL